MRKWLRFGRHVGMSAIRVTLVAGARTTRVLWPPGEGARVDQYPGIRIEHQPDRFVVDAERVRRGAAGEFDALDARAVAGLCRDADVDGETVRFRRLALRQSNLDGIFRSYVPPRALDFRHARPRQPLREESLEVFARHVLEHCP